MRKRYSREILVILHVNVHYIYVKPHVYIYTYGNYSDNRIELILLENKRFS